MHTHLILPFAPLVFRTGKPFGETGGGDSFSFPLPSTVAGAMRTVYGDQDSLDFIQDRTVITDCRNYGPLPASLSANGSLEPCFPFPADARYIKPEMDLLLQRLFPMDLQDNEGSDLPDGLLPVFLESENKFKPASGPSWWTDRAMQQWLQGSFPDITTIGPAPLPIDTRIHVALDPETLASDSGKLFQSTGLDFDARYRTSEQEISERGWNTERYALLTRFSERLNPTMFRLGGEARLSAISTFDMWPKLSKALEKILEKAPGVRLILATPALFSEGWKPGWLNNKLTGSPPGIPNLVLCLRAAAINRWQAISGWDLSAKKPKAVRRLVPAGSVYWFEVIQSEKGWVDKLWLSPISDGDQDQSDGFGLVLPGIWKK